MKLRWAMCKNHSNQGDFSHIHPPDRLSIWTLNRPHVLLRRLHQPLALILNDPTKFLIFINEVY